MKFAVIGFYFFSGLFLALSASASSMMPISLEQLSTRASIIFYGEVVSNEVQRDSQSGQLVTFTTFNVLESIKGNTTSTHTIKQLGGKDPEANINLRIYGIPEFQTNNRYVIFLPEKSSIGFSSPLGLHQGSFSVTTENGELMISNGRSLISPTSNTAPNKSVQMPLAGNSRKPSQARLEDFINTVRTYNTP